jgi:chromosome segregation ATPase
MISRKIRSGFSAFNPFILVALLATPFIACSSVYYSVWEKLGKEKRDLLIDNLESARSAQVTSQKEFKDALVALQVAYGKDQSELQSKYDKLKGEYEQSESSSKRQRDRIENVHKVATDLFDEWKREADTISSPSLKRESLAKRDTTIERYKELRTTLLSSYDTMTPILSQLRDYVYFLKHNLNAQALGSLQNESNNIQQDIRELISKMNGSIREIDNFVKDLRG